MGKRFSREKNIMFTPKISTVNVLLRKIGRITSSKIEDPVQKHFQILEPLEQISFPLFIEEKHDTKSCIYSLTWIVANYIY